METTQPFAGVPAPLRAAIVARGFEKLTSVQEAVLSSEGAGRNLRISSQTGSGKTLALGIRLASDLIPADNAPAGAREANGPRALLITPTRELAVQVAGELRWLFAQIKGVAVEVVTGGSDMGRERRALSKSPAVLVGTPGRLLDHMRSRTLNCSSFRQVVLDEADQMLDMGFRDELEAILEFLPADRCSHLVSATFPAAVKRFADRFQENPLHVEGTRLGVANADIQHVAHRIRPREMNAAIINVLLHARGERVLVFVRRRVDATELAEKLSANGLAAAPFSGELNQTQRTRTLNAFKHGEQDILIATDVAARGIDVPEIDMVIHADVPADVENYTHRSGRTGRAGRKGRSVLMVPVHAQNRVRRIFSQAGVEAQWQPVPSPAQIEKHYTKTFRRDLHAILSDSSLVSKKQTSYAKFLLDQPEQRDPIEILAALLQMAEPKPALQGYAIADVSEGSGHSRDSRGPRHPRNSGPRRKASFGSFQRFEINWGTSKGATASRILSHLCRRGNVSSSEVGAIRLGPAFSTFEISKASSESFEKAARLPDERDPNLNIRRSQGNPKPEPSRRPAPYRGKRRESYGGRAATAGAGSRG
ncbi:MAG: DEAD/DEAH box helicase [Planctomycetota bacterium]|nr:DEAD/DEAH box helicase [Planctomycetota bacterium]